MASSGSGTQTVTEKADPWSGAQPYITDVLSKARAQSNLGGQFYNFSTVVPFSSQTKAGMAGMENEAAAQVKNLSGDVFGQASKTLAGDYMGGSEPMQDVYGGSLNVNDGTLRALTSQAPNPTEQYLTNYATGSGDVQGVSGFDNVGTPANDYLASTARGDMLDSNPHLDATFDRMADKVSAAHGAQFSRAGMFGSTNHADELADGLGDLANDVYGSNYARERANQMAAAGIIQGAHDTAQGRNLAASQFNTGVNETNMARRMDAASRLQGAHDADESRRLTATGMAYDNNQRNMDRRAGAAGAIDSADQSERNRQLQYTGMTPQLNAAAFQPYEKMLEVGQMREEQAGRTLQDAMARHDFEQRQPWNDLANYSAIINGYSNIGGQSTTSQPLYRNRASGAIGGALSGAALGSVVPGLGTGVGAVLGGIGGLL